MKAIILDTETTGNEPPEVIELAYEDYNGNAAQIREPYCNRFKPSKPIAFGALAVHHILDEELEWCEASNTACIPKDIDYIIGHNIDYDWKALGSPPVKRICTLAIARHLYPQLDSHKLGAMVYLLAPSRVMAREQLQFSHSAAQDVKLCAAVLSAMLLSLDNAPTDLESLWQFSEKARIPSIMAFGKHKGMAIRDLPRDYKAWMLRQADMDEYLLKAVRETL